MILHETNLLSGNEGSIRTDSGDFLDGSKATASTGVSFLSFNKIKFLVLVNAEESFTKDFNASFETGSLNLSFNEKIILVFG